MTPPRRANLGRIALALCGSLFTHGAIAVAIVARLVGGHAGGAGEDGRAGAGDTTVDVTLAGATATPKANDAPKPTPTQEEAVAPAPPPTAAAATPQTPSESSETRSGKLAGPVIVATPLSGFGQSSIEGQRALLPRAAVCKDPVAGKWEALKFSPAHGDWVHFTLTVRHRGTGLDGLILSHTWAGGVFDRDPPACTSTGFDITVSMRASGRATGGQISFGSSSDSYSIVRVQCAQPGHDYAPDHFTGHVDAARQEFQSLNNDGANDIDSPYVFRRTGCLDD